MDVVTYALLKNKFKTFLGEFTDDKIDEFLEQWVQEHNTKKMLYLDSDDNGGVAELMVK